ncbi:MAG: hypothetical protein ACU84Q_13330 [Gammaproteobacteria bacterium]
MPEISENAVQLLKVLAQNENGNSRWVAGDFASIYDHSDPDIEATIEELSGQALIKPADLPLGRRRTDSYEITSGGLEFLNQET